MPYTLPMISVVIPTRQSGDVLARCLGSLIPAAIDGLIREVIIVDANSTDQTREIAEDAGADILLTEGHPESRLRTGAIRARHPYLLLLSPRAALDGSWTTEAEHFLASPASKLRPAAFRYRIQHGARIGFRRRFLETLQTDQRLLIARVLFDGNVRSRPLRLRSAAWFC